jgi:hypothetical protein
MAAADGALSAVEGMHVVEHHHDAEPIASCISIERSGLSRWARLST